MAVTLKEAKWLDGYDLHILRGAQSRPLGEMLQIVWLDSSGKERKDFANNLPLELKTESQVEFRPNFEYIIVPSGSPGGKLLLKGTGLPLMQQPD